MKLTAFIAALLLGTTAMAQTAAPAAPTFTFALKGFVSMSAAYQTGQIGLSEGQMSLFSATPAAPVGGKLIDQNTLTFDVRQTRLNFSVKGPTVLFGATPSAVVEIDFFQGFGGGNYGDVSLLNRMRLAYSELNWGDHRLQLGQQNDLVVPFIPASLSHIAFPLGYMTGTIGWRRPGIFGFHNLAVTPDVKVEAAWEVGRSQWADASNGGAAGVTIGGAAANQPGGYNQGEASGAPAVEGRVAVSFQKLFWAFAAAHYSNMDPSGFGAAAALGTSTKHSISTVAYNGGLKVTIPVQGDMALTVQGTGFTGKNLGPLIANFTTGANAFKFGPNGEDLNTMGYWAQVGFNLTKEFSLWGFYGGQQIKKADFAKNALGVGSAYENATTNVMAMYRDGGYGLSAEWINFQTKYATAVSATDITGNRTSKADQYMLTANYFF